MSIRIPSYAPRGTVAIAGLMAAALALTGCSSLGSRTLGDSTTTSALPQASPASYSQSMPSTLGAPQAMVAENQFLPPGNIGGAGMMPTQSPQPLWSQPQASPAWNQPVVNTAAAPTVQSQDLPVLSSSSQGSLPAMPAQSALAVAPAPSSAALGTLPTNSSVPSVAAAPAASMPPAANSNGTVSHTIAGGESLYTIARRYEVTTQALVQANNLSSPDKIVVGQQIVIPGRPDLANQPAPTQVAAVTAPAAATVATLPTAQPAAPAPVATSAPVATPAPVAAPVAQPTAAPVQVATAPAAEPTSTSSDRFNWPVSGRVIVDFASSRGTGINIEAAAGTPVKAAGTGTVIYTGSGVEGYGNLVLIRHSNGYVSAYAHLDNIGVAKGATVNRGDSIGTAGQTGSVTRPQLHFELRRGATPVDPMPLLAG
jgi:murein DD-endopeptidase MepM/ murein hydrolase activator NlpD